MVFKDCVEFRETKAKPEEGLVGTELEKFEVRLSDAVLVYSIIRQ